MRAFGLTADGHPVHAASLEWPDGLSVEVLDYGSIVHRLRRTGPDGPRDLILGYGTLEEYERDPAYVCALVGRVANRIAGGRFPLDGREVQVSVNEPPNTLHGGNIGFNKRIWRFEHVAEDGRSLRLAYDSPDGEEGFPGAAAVTATYSLTAPDTLQIEYGATSSAPTPLALSQHLYFNLLGDRSATILDHRLQIAADGFTPVGPGLIPTGRVAPVEGTPFDFRAARRIADVLAMSDPQLELPKGLDLNWVLSHVDGPALRLAAPDGSWMEVYTDQPGIQVYSGQLLTTPFVAHGALAVEPQAFPDAVNHPNFPGVILHPGSVYHWRSRYRFGHG